MQNLISQKIWILRGVYPGLRSGTQNDVKLSYSG